ncbi:MAG: hypothetical protein AB8D52_11755 [Gammaproteobacteria bacterium]
MIVVPESLKDKQDIVDLTEKINTYIYSDDSETGPDYEYLKTLVPVVRKYEQQHYTVFQRQPSLSSKSIKDVIEDIPLLKRNMNFSTPVEKWLSYYQFPSKMFVKEYLNSSLFGDDIHIANESRESIKTLCDELISLSMQSKDPSSVDVQYLLGTTGVGKTTFLKYFTKTNKSYFFQNKVIISRIKHRDLENSIALAIDKEDAELHLLDEHYFEKYIVNCIFRDCISDIADAFWNSRTIDSDSNLEVLLLKYIERIHINSKVDDTDIVDQLIRSDELVLNSFELAEKIDFINHVHNSGYRFNLVFDGFDAISPEDIQLVDSKKDQLFIDLLRKATTNGFLTHQCSSGICLKNLYLTLLIAARPATLAELIRGIQGDVDFGYRQSAKQWTVVGCEMVAVFESRLTNYLPKSVRGSKEFSLYWNLITYVLNRIRLIYPSIEENKFIDLFNHNTREKIYFLCDVIEYMVAKIEEQYAEDLSVSQNSESGVSELKLDDVLISSYLRNNRIECPRHELDYLLVLNGNGVFENHFIHKGQDKYVLNPSRGILDNMFNYSRKTKDNSWTYRSDPLLIKYYVLKHIELSGQTTIESLIQWVKDSGHFELTNQEVSFLIRAGLITVEFSDMAMYLSITKRGVFVISELLFSNVYFEHALLRTLAPKFIADTCTPPSGKGNSRVWGLISVFNMIRFLKYIRIVDASQRSFVKGTFNQVPSIYPTLEEKIGIAIISIINEGLSSGSAMYFPKLQQMLLDLEDEME